MSCFIFNCFSMFISSSQTQIAVVIGFSLGHSREKWDGFFDVRVVCINSGQSPQSDLLAVLLG